MQTLLVNLSQWGCDVQGALARLLDDPEFYIDCLKQVADDPAFEALGTALEQNQTQAAFDAAHTLKGVLANMGLTPLLDPVIRIVEPLRRGELKGVQETYKELIAKQRKLKEFIANSPD